MQRKLFIIAGVVTLAGIGFLDFYRVKTYRPAPLVVPKTPAMEITHADDAKLDQFVSANKTSPDKKVQDAVASARMRLGYAAAKRKDWGLALATFKTASSEYKGTGEASPEFGSLDDQAQYQALVCLVAEGKKEEARDGFKQFIKDRPLSPLVQACYSRLSRLNGGESTPEYDNLLQAAITKQEANIKFETSVCGPKAIEYLVSQNLIYPKDKNVPTDYKSLAKLCGTGDRGTSIDGLRKGLRALGIESYAYKVNRQDVVKAKLPLIYLEQDHFLIMTKIEGLKATIYDTRYRSSQTMQLPALDDPDFALSAVLFAPLEVGS